MRFGFADPPYLGCCARYKHYHPDGLCWDDLSTHACLIERLSVEYEGWALCLHSPSLRQILRFCPEDVRVCAWVKPFAAWKPNVNPGYCWEPVIVWGGRKLGRDVPTVRDYVSCNITLQKGTIGAKPDPFSNWLFEFVGLQADDEFVDIYKGSGAVGEAWDKWRNQLRVA
jgi:hypothetical protein